MYSVSIILGLLVASKVVTTSPLPKPHPLESRGLTYPDGSSPSTDWTYPSNGLMIKTPAFHGGPELTFHGDNLDDAYSKLLQVNSAWNCTMVGGCPSKE